MSSKKNVSTFVIKLSAIVLISGIAIATAGILLPLDKKISIALSNTLLALYLGLLIGYLLIVIRKSK
jgi:hypothetical protein